MSVSNSIPDILGSVSERVVTRLTELVGRKVPVSRDDKLSQLIAESFALVEIAIELQEEFAVDLSQEDLKHVNTAGELADLIAARAAAR